MYFDILVIRIDVTPLGNIIDLFIYSHTFNFAVDVRKFNFKQ